MNRHGGGVAFYVEYGLEFNQIELDLPNLQLITIQSAIPFVKPILVTACYKSPDNYLMILKKF